MNASSPSIPHLTVVRIATEGGPYRSGDLVSLAFNEPTIVRMMPHDSASSDVRAAPGVVPETVSAVVQISTDRYRRGEVVMLSFVDPSVARLHVAYAPSAPTLVEARTEPGSPVRIVAATASSASVTAASAAPGTDGPRRTARALPTSTSPRQVERRLDHGPILRLDWPPERAARFVQVADKLFTVDRLGWYRHVLATRLLVPEEIGGVESPEPAEAYAGANATLKIVRLAGLEALGTPLLAAYLPTFAVSSEWLAAINDIRLSSALETLDDQLGRLDREALAHPTPVRGSIVTSLGAALDDHPALEKSFEALLPRLVPTVASDADVSEALARYRESYLELFAQMAPAAGAVRLRQMAQPNTVLDDRLWTLVGAVQASLTSEATATGP